MVESLEKGHKELLAIVGIAFLPFLIAGVLFIGFPSDEIPDDTVNEGLLIIPPIQIEVLESDGKWLLIHIVTERCSDECREVLFLTKQSRKALGKNAARVRRIAVASHELTEPFMQLIISEHKSLSLTVDSQVVDALSSAIQNDAIANFVFLMDPLGNVMMYYTPEILGKPLLQDLRRLLRVSRIGWFFVESIILTKKTLILSAISHELSYATCRDYLEVYKPRLVLLMLLSLALLIDHYIFLVRYVVA